MLVRGVIPKTSPSITESVPAVAISKVHPAMVPVAVLLSLADQQSGHSSADMQRMDTAKPGEPAHLLKNRRVAVKHKISFFAKTMFIIWKKAVPNKTSVRHHR